MRPRKRLDLSKIDPAATHSRAAELVYADDQQAAIDRLTERLGGLTWLGQR